MALRFTAETRGVLEMQDFTPAYMKVWTHVSTEILSEPNFLWYIDDQIFLRMVLRCARKRESSAKISVI